MTALSARLDLTPADAARYFLGKSDAISWDYTDTWRGANAHSFTVAKATTADVLATIRKEMTKVKTDGMSFADFKRGLRPRLEALGWWGTKEVLDGDSGELTRVQLGSNRRLRTIFQTNVQTGYMAGRYKRYVEDAQTRPYWRYVAVMDGRTRPEHAALNGKVWRWDDPIWAIIWPPNGWGCRCRVQALTEAEFKALGVPLEDGAQAIVTRQVPIGRDQQLVDVQGVRHVDEAGKPRVFMPDPGWDYNPGAAWSQHDFAGFKGAVRVVNDTRSWQDVGQPDLLSPELPRLPDPGQLPAAPSRDAARDMMGTVLLQEGRMRAVTTPIERVFVRPELLDQVVSKAHDARERFAPYVLPTLEQPLEVWLTPFTDGSYRKSYISLFGRELVALVRENRDGTLFWEVFNALQADPLRLNGARFGTLLFGREHGGD